MSFIFGGLHVGSLLGLFVAPPLIERFGWPTVFYAFGFLGEYSSLIRISGNVLDTNHNSLSEGAASESKLWFASVLADTVKLLLMPTSALARTNVSDASCQVYSSQRLHCIGPAWLHCISAPGHITHCISLGRVCPSNQIISNQA